MKNVNCDCSQKENKNMVVACSGAADVGYISDRVGRMLSISNHCKMSCLALFASCSERKIENLKNNNIVVIDGCNENCGKKIMDARGIGEYKWLRLSDLGYEKGKTQFSSKLIETIHNEALKLMA